MAAQCASSDSPSVALTGSRPWNVQMSNPASDLTTYGDIELSDDRRDSDRRNLRCPMQMIDPSLDAVSQESRAIPAECLNLSQWGLYGTVKIGYGVAIGQRYVFRLRIKELGPEPGSVRVISQEGLIVRTELLLAKDGDRVGISVRLCGHRAGLRYQADPDSVRSVL
jgi:hypothetical protein